MTASFARFLHALVLAVLAGCSTLPPSAPTSEALVDGRVSARLIEPDDSERYSIAPGVTFDQPVAFPGNPLPRYPGDLLAERLGPVSLRVRLAVDTAGVPSGVEALDSLGGHDARFLDEIEHALLQWRFTPLVRIESGPGHSIVAFGDVMTRYEGSATALPFYHDYSFEFRQTNGVPRVEAGQ
jgi:hypothetical protein